MAQANTCSGFLGREGIYLQISLPHEPHLSADDRQCRESHYSSGTQATYTQQSPVTLSAIPLGAGEGAGQGDCGKGSPPSSGALKCFLPEFHISQQHLCWEERRELGFSAFSQKLSQTWRRESVWTGRKKGIQGGFTHHFPPPPCHSCVFYVLRQFLYNDR